MQSLQQELDPSPQSVANNDHPVLRGLMADQAVAYAEEVRALRQRVAVLEAELAAAKASQAIDTTKLREAPPLTSIDVAPPCRQPQLQASEFTESHEPAVVAASPTHSVTAIDTVAPAVPDQPAAAPAQAQTAEPSEPVSNPGFAKAWSDEEETSSFEERIAEKAFFEASSIDEQSRSWLLES